jgi:flagellar hook protein FlgE
MSKYTIALAGLENTAHALDAVSNNIANANTVGYKAGHYLFADQFIKAVNPADAARVGMGTQTQGVRRPMTQGTINNSQNPLDMAISGDGMFMLKKDGTDPTGTYYTRNGQFRLNTKGEIVNENGMRLLGFDIKDHTAGSLSAVPGSADTVMTLPPTEMFQATTTKSSIGTILDSRGQAYTSTSGVAFDPTQSTYNSKTTQTVYDADGNTHTLDVYYRMISAGSKSITWDATANGWTYTPGPSSRPNTLGNTKVTINADSIVSVDTAADYTDAVGEGSTGALLTMTNPLPDSVVLGAKVFKNGVDTGTTVTDKNLEYLTLSGAVPVNKGDSISFYLSPTYQDTVTEDSTGTSVSLDSTIGGNIATDSKVFKNGVDTGITVISTSDNEVELSGELSVTEGDMLSFLNSTTDLKMTMTAPDGTKIPVTGTSNRQSDGNELHAVTDEVEVYASFDGHFYDHDTNYTADWNLSPQTTGLGFKPVAKISFLGGKNIDGLMKDPQSGNPTFSTVTRLSNPVATASGKTLAENFNLDLTDTRMMASDFQVVSSVQDGEPVSKLTNVTIDNQGRIIGVYGNGKQYFHQQVALIHFDNPEGLAPVGDNVFSATEASGSIGTDGVRVGSAGQGPFGDIKSMALEASNVDLASELVQLMVLQRSYTANSQAMRAVDQLTRDTLQMIS